MNLEAWNRWWKQDGTSELRELVMREWDPIGVAHVPEAADEYDSYLWPLALSLRAGASAPEITERLAVIRAQMIGLRADEATEMRVAELIVDWYRRSTARFEATQ